MAGRAPFEESDGSEVIPSVLHPADYSDDVMAALGAAMPGIDNEVLMAVLKAKKGDPSSFASLWEDDESGVEPVSMEELDKDPKKKILWAAENNMIEVVREMIGENADLVESRDEDLYTPLHRASYNDHVDMVTLLIESGADLEAETMDGWRPIHSAARWSNHRVVSLLLRCGADSNAQTHGGQTALHLAAANQDSRETLTVLLMHDTLLPNIKNAVGETAKDICLRTSELYKLFEMTDESINLLRQTKTTTHSEDNVVEN